MQSQLLGGLDELCSPDVKCEECVDVSDFIFDVVNKNIEKLTKRNEQTQKIKEKTPHRPSQTKRETLHWVLANHSLSRCAGS